MRESEGKNSGLDNLLATYAVRIVLEKFESHLTVAVLRTKLGPAP